MTLDSYFDIKRFGYLLKKEVFSNLKLFIIALGAMSGILLIIFLVDIIDWENDGYLNRSLWNNHMFFFIPPYLIIGVLFTSLAYKDLLQVNKAYAYLTLPVSNFERALSMLLMTTVIYTIFFIVYYMVFSTLLNGLGMIITAREFGWFDVTAEPVVMAIKLYLVIQSIFLLGAAAFKKFPFLFTLLTIFLAAVALIILTVTLANFMFSEFFHTDNRIDVPDFISKDLQNFIEYDLPVILENVFWYVLAPVCWVITYLKLKEREI
ncbi:hypothetical protein QQ020_19715 [Fulvivirgaceae bacterium BMA12]|uniref:ABC transporter permease n=1 Tax=Agaribacillus aureus TaxID=3051825 RepID=A0ABT8LB85_9BACT|nr:hypothetical protein [Fulvivirgaceae bacterium BMA12]